MSTIEKALNRLAGGTPQAPAPRPPMSGKSQQPAVELDDPDALRIDRDMLFSAGMLVPGMGRSLIAEEFRHIKRPLLSNVLGTDGNSIPNANLIMVTSALPGEGKTFSSVNLAISIAMEMDHTCLLVDADVARPSVMRTLGVYRPEAKGLVDYLSDERLHLSELLLKTDIPKLTVLPSGRGDVHATELLASESMRRLVQELSVRYHDRIVIFDSPPLLATSESRVLASLVGQIVVVVEAEKTQQAVFQQAMSLLDQNKYIGLVLNKDRRVRQTDYYYGYGVSDKK